MYGLGMSDIFAAFLLQLRVLIASVIDFLLWTVQNFSNSEKYVHYFVLSLSCIVKVNLELQ